MILRVLLLFFLCVPSVLQADFEDFSFGPVRQPLRYKEDFFRLNAKWLTRDADSLSRSIYFLELASVLPFDHPIKALIPIQTEQQYEKYQLALMMHIMLQLTDSYIQYGNLYMKNKLYFYNKEFAKDYADGYDVAQFYHRSARLYWQKTMDYAQKAGAISVELNPELSHTLVHFDDMISKVRKGLVDYNKPLDKLESDIASNRSVLESWQL